MTEQETEQPVNPLLVPKRRETVLLYRPDIAEKRDSMIAELDELSVKLLDLDDRIELMQAEKDNGTGAPTKMARKTPLEVAQTERPKLEKQRDKKAAEIDELLSTETPVQIVLQEPSSVAYTRLMNTHPPREGDRLDQIRGWNGETFPVALARLCLVEPQVTEPQWAEFADSVSAYNWRGKILPAIYRLTDAEPDLPKPFAVSVLQQVRADESKPQRASG